MAWSAPITSAALTCDANYECLLDSSGDPLVIEPNPREIVDFIFSIASEVGETDNLEWQILAGHRIIEDSAMGTVGGTTIIDVASGDNQANDYYMGMYFLPTSPGVTEVGDLREIIDYVSSTDALTLIRALTGTPTIGELYDIFHLKEIAQGIITAETALTEDLSQNGGPVPLAGYSVLIPRVRATGGTDAHEALVTYATDGVSV